jgi:hypothetical protein
MKDAYRLHIFLAGAFYLLLIFLITSCEQEEAVVELNTAPGGGTVSTYKAYELDAMTEDEVYGRIVFYKDNSGYTLVQVSLYNTDEETEYPTKVFSGTIETEAPETIMPLYAINGSTGEFATSKFYVIEDKTFYDGLTDLNAHLKVMMGDDIIAAGNIGKNATPVAESE